MRCRDPAPAQCLVQLNRGSEILLLDLHQIELSIEEALFGGQYLQVARDSACVTPLRDSCCYRERSSLGLLCNQLIAAQSHARERVRRFAQRNKDRLLILCLRLVCTGARSALLADQPTNSEDRERES